MHSDRLTRTNADTQATTIPDRESAKKKPHTLYERAYKEEDVTHAVPLQPPGLLGPSITLQYDPAGKPVANVAFHSLSQLLMATKPSEPVSCHARYSVCEQAV
jgi:hypothetical protein